MVGIALYIWVKVYIEEAGSAEGENKWSPSVEVALVVNLV